MTTRTRSVRGIAATVQPVSRRAQDFRLARRSPTAIVSIGCGEARPLLAVRFYKLRQSRWFGLRFAVLTLRRDFDRFCPRFPNRLFRDACLVSIHKKTNRGSCYHEEQRAK